MVDDDWIALQSCTVSSAEAFVGRADPKWFEENAEMLKPLTEANRLGQGLAIRKVSKESEEDG